MFSNNAIIKQQSATLYTIQLGLNLIYMPLFFKFKRPIEATVDIAALTGTTAYLTYIYSQIDSVAAWGFAPYLGWLTFATYLSVRTTHKDLINSFFVSSKILSVKFLTMNVITGRHRLPEQLGHF